MGVRGLTSYIARHAEIYLKPYELHDCNLVIDGDNLACNLYRDVTGNYSAFGGDYDDFYRAVVQFFQVLVECNVHAYVLMDGGYEPRKLRTVSKRLRGKISVIKRINPCASITLFPLHMKEVFIDAVRDCEVPVMRCIFEADDELAALARKLNCPVLSYDSDFYIHNVRYIPLITLTVKAHTKVVKTSNTAGESQINDVPAVDVGRRLRKNEAKHVEKRTKAHKVMSGGVQTTSTDKKTKKRGKTYKYLDCCIYRIEHLCGRGALSAEKLPLFAALLGNDYIARSSFKNFFAAGMGKGGRSRKMRQQQRRIRIILQWLKQETCESALRKILSRLKQNQRESLLAQVQAAISGYSNEICHSYDFFSSYYTHSFEDFVNEKCETEASQESENDELADSLQGSDEEQVSDAEEEPNVQNNGNDDVIEKDADKDIDDDDDSANDDEDTEEDNEDTKDKSQYFPDWFLQKLYPAHLSRFFVDLVYLRKYINNPQIEHFPHKECNEIALPILKYIFTLLNHVKDAVKPPSLDDDGNPLPIDFTYLTRAVRVTNVCYVRHAIERPPKYDFEPASPDVRHLRYVFEQTRMPELNVELLFERVQDLPSDLKLYFLAVVYWLHKSQHCDLLHLNALIIGLVLLRTIDATIPAERDLRAFQKRFGKIINKERLIRNKEAVEGIKRSIKPSLLELPVAERMAHVPKSDCYLVQDRLLPLFHMQEIFKKKYDLYSTVILHAFAEFQSTVYQLNGLNALLDLPYESPRMGQLYCGVLLYNLYDSLRTRIDIKYHVQHYIFPDSQLMYEFYCYLYDWCAPFVPSWKQVQSEAAVRTVNKKLLKKKRQAARKQAAAAAVDPNADMLNKDVVTDDDDKEDFFDLNNQFCALKVS